MDEKTKRALERFQLDIKAPATLGPTSGAAAPTKSKAEREAAALTRLLQQRQALVEGDKWRTIMPFVAIFALAILGIAAAMRSSISGAVAVAVAGATATMFRLLQVTEQQKGRAMIFSVIQAAAQSGKYPPTDLVQLLLTASQLPTSEAQAKAKPTAPVAEQDGAS